MSIDLIKSIEECISSSNEKITNREALIPLKDEIKKAINAGYNVKKIYKGLCYKGIISCSYQHFCQIFHRFFPEYGTKSNSDSSSK
ncbi:MAG: hypothetical protein IKO41_00265 [Lachnospiraceae bacterium]|nr:hypothetical protein [Lachnospiraceae bacterium]